VGRETADRPNWKELISKRHQSRILALPHPRGEEADRCFRRRQSSPTGGEHFSTSCVVGSFRGTGDADDRALAHLEASSSSPIPLDTALDEVCTSGTAGSMPDLSTVSSIAAMRAIVTRRRGRPMTRMPLP